MPPALMRLPARSARYRAAAIANRLLENSWEHKVLNIHAGCLKVKNGIRCDQVLPYRVNPFPSMFIPSEKCISGASGDGGNVDKMFSFMGS